MSEYILETKGLTKKYGDFTAVQDINLHVRKNDIYGFVGKNGAGKSTCMKMISRPVPSDSRNNLHVRLPGG